MNTESKPSTTTTTRANLSAIERIELTSNAWRTHAPEAKFANKNWAEYRSATEMSRFYRTKVATLNLQVKGGVATRSLADKATRAVINKVIAGVKADDAYGPDSALYRAMGFIPLQEHKRPGSRTPLNAAAPSTPSAPATPKASKPRLMVRLAKVRSAWAEIAPNQSLAGLTLAQFDEAVSPSNTARAGNASNKTNLRAAIGLRKSADAVSLALVRRVVSGIKADEAYGPDSALYRALGYIPDSERRSARRSAAPVAGTTTTTPAVPAK